MSYVERPGKSVFRHGKRIETVELVPTAALRQQQKKEEAFVLMPLARAAEVTKCMKAKGVMVWIVLLYLVWKNKKQTVKLSNEVIKHYGVSRHVKYRALVALEAAGIIAVEWQNGRTPLVNCFGANLYYSRAESVRLRNRTCITAAHQVLSYLLLLLLLSSNIIIMGDKKD
jgi:hypothetical protein